MSILHVDHIHTLLPLYDDDRAIHDGAVVAEDGVLLYVGPRDAVPEALRQQAQHKLRLDKHVVLPGLVNTHHHMFQSLTRAFAQDQSLFGWLTTLYPIWQHLTGEMAYASARLAMAELMLSGCTTSSDHHYLFPNDVTLDDTIRAAMEMGLRFHPTRGSMSVGESQGGLPPDRIVETDEQHILTDTRRVIEQYHDPERYAMLRVGVAPCAPFNVSQDLMRESATLARSYGVRLHTHLAENQSDIDYSLAHFGQRPGDYAEAIGWVGDDVWHAHCVQLNPDEIGLFARTGTGVCHCPGSNLRLGSGIAPVRAMRDAGVPVGLGVDGSASNDSGHLLQEARLALLLQRVNGTPDPARFSPADALHLATHGGAAVLGRDDIGRLAPGYAADFIAYRIDHPALAGSHHDLLAALALSPPAQVDLSVINGQIVIEDGQFVRADLAEIVETHNRHARSLLVAAGLA